MKTWLTTVKVYYTISKNNNKKGREKVNNKDNPLLIKLSKFLLNMLKIRNISVQVEKEIQALC